MEHDAWVTDFREWSLAETSAAAALAATNFALISANELRILEPSAEDEGNQAAVSGTFGCPCERVARLREGGDTELNELEQHGQQMEDAHLCRAASRSRSTSASLRAASEAAAWRKFEQHARQSHRSHMNCNNMTHFVSRGDIFGCAFIFFALLRACHCSFKLKRQRLQLLLHLCFGSERFFGSERGNQKLNEYSQQYCAPLT